MNNTTVTPHGHAHGEAFCRMKYRCDACGHWEWVWNSRDGVTPFAIASRCHDADSVHVLWREDTYAPNYQPQPGERYFRDGTRAEAVAIMARRLDRFAEQGHVPTPEVRDACMAAAREGRDEFRDGWPFVAEVPS